MNLKLQLALGALLPILACRTALASNFDSVYAFGDSLSDGGDSASAVISIYKLNGNACDPGHPCPPYVDGRFSNGPVAIEYAASALLNGGANAGNFFDYAVGGATTGVGNIGDNGSEVSLGALNLPGVANEVNLYLGQHSDAADANALYFLQGGANDLLAAAASEPASLPSVAISAADELAADALTLAKAGAQHIEISNLADLSLTPKALAYGALIDSEVLAVTEAFNVELAKQLVLDSASAPRVGFVEFNAFALSDQVFNNPATYGFTNVSNPCLTGLTVCSDPATYAFWDTLHSTTALNVITGEEIAAAAMPLPSAAWLFAGGLASAWLARHAAAKRLR